MSEKINFKKISIFEGPTRSLGFLVWHISTTWRSSIAQALKPFYLTHPQFVILASLGWLTRDGNRVTQAAVGEMACLDPNTTSQIIRGLEQKGLITRERSLDTRSKNPLITQQGKETLTQALAAVETADSRFFDCLSKAEIRSLLGIFQTLTGSG